MEVNLNFCKFNISDFFSLPNDVVLFTVKHITTDLTIVLSSSIQIGCPAQNNAALRRYILCGIVFSVICHKLPRKNYLRYVIK